MDHETKIIIEAESESSVRMSFGNSIDEQILQRITAINESLHYAPFPGFIESVPAYTTLTVFYDPLLVKAAANEDGIYASALVINYLEKFTNEIKESRLVPDTVPFKIPVCYGGQFGPDIEEVAEFNKLQVEEVIRLHAERIYLVYMVGFLPGFPYLGGMNAKLATPRRLSPRKVVPAGSVGIAGEQTGIYPLSSPGGWQLIGRTPMRLFDSLLHSPALLHAGNRIQFSSITSSEFKYLSSDD